MMAQSLRNLGFAVRETLAHIGYGARLFVRLLFTLKTSLQRF